MKKEGDLAVRGQPLDADVSEMTCKGRGLSTYDMK